MTDERVSQGQSSQHGKINTLKSWSQVASSRIVSRDGYDYNQEHEVHAKMPEKRSREYIYQMLEKIKFPLMEIEGIVERRGMVDFTCSSRKSAERLAASLSTRQEISFARVRDPEYTDVKFHWVPANFPDGRIKDVLYRLYGEIRYSRILKDRRGKADGRRIYSVKTETLKLKPIPATVRLSGRVFLVEYASQPLQCFVCKEFGHVRSDCPNYSPVKLLPANVLENHVSQEAPDYAINEDTNSNQATQGDDHPRTTSETSGNTDEDGFTLVQRQKTRRAKKLTLRTMHDIDYSSTSSGMDATHATDQSKHGHGPELPCKSDTIRAPTSTPIVSTQPYATADGMGFVPPTSTAADGDEDRRDDAATAEDFVPTSTDADFDGEQIDDVATAEGNAPVKRLFSPDTSPECTELVKRGKTNFFNCYCGLKMIKPAKTGELVTCECSSQYMLCVCQYVFKVGEKGEAVCNSCYRQMPILGLDMTV